MGYNAEEYIEIDETELEKALYCFQKNGDAIFNKGAVRGVRINAIVPDYHRAMNWNRGYRLMALDYEELSERGVNSDHIEFLAMKKEKILYLVSSGAVEMIGKNMPIPGFEDRKALPRGGGMKHIAGKI